MGISNFLGLFGKGKRQPCAADKQLAAHCQICLAMAPYLDTVDFNKSCEEVRGTFLPPSNIPVHYYLCAQCGFCFAPEFYSWPVKKFAEEIYNNDYELVDPDYKFTRPTANAEFIDAQFGKSRHLLRHLDYGGGSGLLSRNLQQKGWTSESYDPFVNPELSIEDLGSFDLVTAFEVFEHVPDIDALLDNLRMLCKPDGMILFSTLVSDGHIATGHRLDWWYASPRNGHISLFSADSLNQCMTKNGLRLGSFSNNLHLACRELPAWAGHLVKT
ncbi:MAG TPA: class I SAM-dependent methyltransferase [Usitatibacteraceae bacterium]